MSCLDQQRPIAAANSNTQLSSARKDLRASAWALEAAMNDQRIAAARFRSEAAELDTTIQALSEVVRKYERTMQGISVRRLKRYSLLLAGTADRWLQATGTECLKRLQTR